MSSAADPGVRWIPVALGAIDVRGSSFFLPEAEILVVPVGADAPLCLVGAGAALWRRLVEGTPVVPSAVDPEEAALLREFRAAGLAVLAATHPAGVADLRPPVLSSPMHELVYALVARIAADRGIPCVFVKGPALHRQGLRDREHSGDVDVWCEPARCDELATALEQYGWTREPDPWWGTSVHHSITLAPGGWGCEIDVHRRIPGLTLPDDEAFAIVARDADQMLYAGVPVPVPAVAVHAVLAAVTLVRPEIGGGARTPQASDAARAVLTRAPGAGARARELGAVPVLREELRTLLPDDDLTDGGVPRDWAWRAQPDRAHAYWHALRTEPLAVRFRLLLRLIWPPDDVALASARRAGEPSASATRARLRRIRRGAREWLRRSSTG